MDAAIYNSSSLLNDEESFGCPANCVITGCEEDWMKCLGRVYSLVKGKENVIFNIFVTIPISYFLFQ